MSHLFIKRFRWAWGVSLLLFSCFLLISISSYLVMRGNIRSTLSESTLPLTSDNVYSEIQRDLLRPVFIASLMAHDTFLRDWAIREDRDEAAITRYLNEIKIKYSTVSSFFVSEKTKEYFYAHGLLKVVNENEPRDEWYFRVKEMEELYEINVDPDLANADEMTVFINYRTFDYRGEFIGATGVGLTVQSVNNLISRYEAKYHRQIYFTDTAGSIVLRPMNSPLLSFKHLNEIKGLKPYLPDLLNGRVNQISYQRDGQRRLLHSRYVPELDWYLFVEQSESLMLAPVQRQLLINITLSIVVTALVAYFCVVVIRRHRDKLEQRNNELTVINTKLEASQRKLVDSSQELEAANQTLQELNREKDDLIGVVAHDLRNPLNAVLGLCQLASSEDDASLREFIPHIQKSGERMLELTNTLLELSRLEGLRGQLETESLILNDVLQGSLAHFQADAKRKKISLELDVSACEGVVIQSHRDWFQVCVGNLVSNALKYTPICGHVSVVARQLDHLIELEVADTGPGISVDEQTRLFGKFVRLSAQPTGEESSVGLGLYIVKKMCDRLGMQIRVQSVLGQGASFILQFPV
jgi:signal transduction histidine kinase